MNNDLKLKQLSKKYFDAEAENYNNSVDGKFVKSMYEEIIKRVIDENPKDILDLGCGNANVISMLLQKTDAKLYGLDLSEKMIDVCKKRIGKRADFVVGDAEKLPYKDESMDVIICNASFHHYPNPNIVLEEMWRTLKKGGVLILGDPTAPKLILQFLNMFIKFSNSGDCKIYSEKGIKNLLVNNNFKIENWKKISAQKFIVSGRKFKMPLEKVSVN